MSPTKKRDLPKYCYARGNRIWVRFKDATGKWVNKPSPYAIDQIDQAARYIKAILKGVAMQVEQGITSELTVRKYAEMWLTEREARGVGLTSHERSRLENYALAYPKDAPIGDYPITELKMVAVRDMMRELNTLKNDDGTPRLASRTRLNIYMVLHNMFESAVVETDTTGVIMNPVKLHKRDLPKKIDADPEWRSQATYRPREIEKLISDPLLPPERRVLYALKALAGMRHGEAAAICWRHRDTNYEPLAKLNVVQAWSSDKHVVKSTKDEHTREVPEHPVLCRILNEWREKHWPRVYGRKPTEDDFIVPTRTMRCIDAGDANHALKRDLVALGLRLEAGRLRDRGGHDMRSFFDTQAIEDDADSLIVRRATHAPPKDVHGGYERFSWSTLCREIAKLKIRVPDGEILKLATDSLHLEKRAGRRWTSLVTPRGLERISSTVKTTSNLTSRRGTGSAAADDASRTSRDVPDSLQSRPLRRLDQAIREGDAPKALAIIRELDRLGITVPAIEPTRPPRR